MFQTLSVRDQLNLSDLIREGLYEASSGIKSFAESEIDSIRQHYCEKYMSFVRLSGGM